MTIGLFGILQCCIGHRDHISGDAISQLVNMLRGRKSGNDESWIFFCCFKTGFHEDVVQVFAPTTHLEGFNGQLEFNLAVLIPWVSVSLLGVRHLGIRPLDGYVHLNSSVSAHVTSAVLTAI